MFPDAVRRTPVAAAHVAPCTRLPFATDIPVRSYLDHALPLSIVVHNSHHVDCLLGTFIQLFFPNDKEKFDRVIMCPALGLHDWQQLGFLDVCERTAFATQLKRPADLTDAVIAHLGDGSYVDICMDEYFLPGRPCHREVHSVHDNMLIGYDLPSRRFYLAGYGTDYEVSLVEFEDVQRAFYDAPRMQRKARRLNIITPRAAAPCHLDDGRLIGQLDDYVNGRATVTPEAMRSTPPYRKARRFAGTWGLNTYDAFIEYLRRTARDRGEVDLRATRTLWEHKACMLRRLRRLEAGELVPSHHGLSQSYRFVEELARSVRFAAYEYNLDRTVTLETSVHDLRAMKEAEEQLLREVVRLLRRHAGQGRA